MGDFAVFDRVILLLGRSLLLTEETLRLCTALSLLFAVVVGCLPVATTAPPLNGILFRDFASNSRIVSLTRDLGRLLPVALPPPLANVGTIGGLAPGDLALEARDDCSFPLPFERPLDLEVAPGIDAPDLVGLGLIPPVEKLLFNLASNFLGSEIGRGIRDLVIDPLRATDPAVFPGPPLPENPDDGRSQQ